jgi:hypothetical protein
MAHTNHVQRGVPSELLKKNNKLKFSFFVEDFIKIRKLNYFMNTANAHVFLIKPPLSQRKRREDS